MWRRKDERKNLYKIVYLHVYLTHGDFPFFLSLCISLSTYSAPSSGGVVFWETFAWGGCLCFLFFFFSSTQGDRRAGGSLL